VAPLGTSESQNSAQSRVVCLQGHPKVQETFRRTMGYVEQNDIHSPNTTVGQCAAAMPVVEQKCNDADASVKVAPCSD
jgi:ABC-type multidrug transport system ATPase subunit